MKQIRALRKKGVIIYDNKKSIYQNKLFDNLFSYDCNANKLFKRIQQ